MTEKELRKLSRYQLLELLVFQTKRADELQQKLDELNFQMKEQEIRLSELGSIAEASMQLSGVFASAQKAADLYLDGAKKQAAEIVETAHRQADALLSTAQLKSKWYSILQQPDPSDP